MEIHKNIDFGGAMQKRTSPSKLPHMKILGEDTLAQRVKRGFERCGVNRVARTRDHEQQNAGRTRNQSAFSNFRKKRWSRERTNARAHQRQSARTSNARRQGKRMRNKRATARPRGPYSKQNERSETNEQRTNERTNDQRTSNERATTTG